MKLKNQLAKYLPTNALDLAVHWIEKHNFQLKITKERLTKLGDFRPPNAKVKYPRISVNHNLNPYAFLVTFVHEVAHLVTYNSTNKRLAPHGPAWKANYIKLLEEVINLNCFPPELLPALNAHINSPSASSCVDTKLHKALRKFDEHAELLLEEIADGVLFKLKNGKAFKKGKRIRKRYECVELFSNRKYAVSPIAEVQLLTEDDVEYIKSKLGAAFDNEIDAPDNDLVKVASLTEGAQFETKRGERFIKGEKIRSRYKCRHLQNGELYTIKGSALVKLVN